MSRTRPRPTALRSGPEGVKAAKRFYGWPEDAEFLVPDGVYEHFADGIGARGKEASESWESAFAEYRADHPDLADEIERIQRRELPQGWDSDIRLPGRREGNREPRLLRARY